MIEMIVLGIDFDNTIICYDTVFYDCAVEKKLVPPEVPKNKNGVRDYLRKIGKEDAWTELQGYVYGPGILKAKPFPGVVEFLEQCRYLGIKVYVISHKTKHPFLGEKYDLHSWALQWLDHHLFFDTAKTGLSRDDVFLELTKEEKIARIKKLECTFFIDDLPEIFDHAQFPSTVKKILFQPESKNYSQYDFSLDSWKEITAILEIDHFLKKQGFADYTVKRMAGGKNNQAFCVETADQKYFLKKYFYHHLDPRDRLATEFSFSRFLWDQGIKSISQPYFCNAELRLGLYHFVAGIAPHAKDISENTVEQALLFFEEMNRYKTDLQAQTIALASEACFTLADHLGCVDRRIRKLEFIPGDSNINKEALIFVTETLIPAWNIITLKIKNDPQLTLTETVPQHERCLSPSDFGFHNTLIDDAGKLTFIDFEYAGWDDPAKMINDFFCQPAVPVSLNYYDSFAAKVFAGSENKQQQIYRAKALLPVYRIKWCCIMLNEFLKAGLERRKFAALELNDTLKAEQLRKVKHYFDAEFEKHKL